jgi:ribonucleoside-diphosphate reductase alpha chain
MTFKKITQQVKHKIMFVLKRDGRKEAIKFDKITARIQKLCYGFSELVDPTAVAMKVIEGIYEGVTTSEPLRYQHQ